MVDALAERGGLPQTIVHGWTLGVEDIEPYSAFRHSRERGLDSLLLLAQAFDRFAPGTKCLLVGVTRSLHAIGLPQPSLSPAAATLAGALKAVPLEYPALSCRHVDLCAASDGSTTT